MADLLVRGLSSATHEELKRRAERVGMSLQAYVAQLLDQHTQAPALDDWLRELDELRRHPELSGAEVIRTARDELL